MDDVARQLRLLARAAHNGRSNLPPATATTLDGPQSQVVQTVEKYVAQSVARVTPALADLDRRISATVNSHPGQELEAITQKAILDIDRVETSYRPQMAVAKASVELASANRERFRAENTIEREGEYPSSRILAAGIVLALTVVEAGMNTYFFALASDQGVVGGLVVSLGCAVVDIFICFSAGRLMTELNHRRVVRRLLGLVPALVVAIWIPTWGLLTGHLREALQAHPDDLTAAWQRAGQHLMETPFGIAQPDTWVLILVGIILSVGGVMQGWRFDDPYPGYGPIDRAHRRSLQAYREVMDAKREAMESVLGSARRSMEVELARVAALVGALDGNVLTIATVRTTMAAFTDQVTRSTNALLKIYRDENMRHRTNGAVPVYFDDEREVSLPPTFHLPEAPAPHDVASAQSRIAQARADYPTYVARLTQRIAEMCGS